MPKIIVSYRRADSEGITGRIVDRLIQQYGKESVFVDIDNIPYGKDFRKHIQQALDNCDAMIEVIGLKWLGGSRRGFTRIKDDADPVRIEVETALRKGIPVIPVLIDGAHMPGASDLPESLTDIVYLNAATVDAGRDFHQHMDRLIRSMDEVLRGAIFSPGISKGIDSATSGAKSSPIAEGQMSEPASTDIVPGPPNINLQSTSGINILPKNDNANSERSFRHVPVVNRILLTSRNFVIALSVAIIAIALPTVYWLNRQDIKLWSQLNVDTESSRSTANNLARNCGEELNEVCAIARKSGGSKRREILVTYSNECFAKEDGAIIIAAKCTGLPCQTYYEPVCARKVTNNPVKPFVLKSYINECFAIHDLDNLNRKGSVPLTRFDEKQRASPHFYELASVCPASCPESDTGNALVCAFEVSIIHDEILRTPRLYKNTCEAIMAGAVFNNVGPCKVQ